MPFSLWNETNKKFNTMTPEILPNAGFSIAEPTAPPEALYG
jgi:hypothetical protein